jgi:hypothetical protein
MPDHFIAEPDGPATHAYPVDTGVMTSTVTRALAVLGAGHPLPRPDDVEVLTSLLCGHVALLLKETKPVLDAMYHGSIEWDRQQAAHDATRRALESGPTHGLAAATIRLRELAYGCERLLALLADARRETGAT